MGARRVHVVAQAMEPAGAMVTDRHLPAGSSRPGQRAVEHCAREGSSSSALTQAEGSVARGAALPRRACPGLRFRYARPEHGDACPPVVVAITQRGRGP